MTKGWRRCLLGSVIRIASGQVDPRDPVTAKLISVGPDNIRAGGGLDQQSLKTGRELGQISGKYAFDSEAILYSKIRPNLNKVALPDFDGICSADMYPMWIRDREVADRNFIFFVLNSEAFVAAATSRSFRTGLPKINRADLESIEIALPPLPEQRRIAELLTTWHDAIDKLRTLRAAKQHQKRGLTHTLLTGAHRFPEFEGQPWATLQLGEVLVEHGLKSTGHEEVHSVSVTKGLVNQIAHLGRSFAASETANYNRVLQGDIVYTRSPTGSFPFEIVKQSRIPQTVIVSPLYGVFTPATPALGSLLDAWFESPIAVGNYLRPLVQKGAKNTIAVTNRRFLEGEWHLPLNEAEQAAILAVIEDSRAAVLGLDSEIAALRHQQLGLKQRLFKR